MDILDRLANSVIEGDTEGTRRMATEALETGVDPLVAIEQGLAKGLKEIGQRFETSEIFLMQLIMSGGAMKAGLDVLKPEILKRNKEFRGIGKVVIGTVEGDLHDIGKSIVSAMLIAEGFEVFDLGVDVPDQVFVDKAREITPSVLGLSALMTTTRTKQKDVIDALKQSGIRDKVKVMVGGATVTPEWAQEIGADAYAEDAVGAAKKARELTQA